MPKKVNEPQTAQMTIFYDGKVMVFNDFPADKAKEIMLLIEKVVLPNYGPAPAPAPAPAPTNDCGNVFLRNSSFASTSGNNSPDNLLQRPPQADASGNFLPHDPCVTSIFFNLLCFSSSSSNVKHDSETETNHFPFLYFFVFLKQICLLQEKLRSTDSWRRERAGRFCFFFFFFL